mgnify:CR=1 FL=1
MVYVLLGTGFEEMEAIAPIDLMRRADIQVLTVGVTGKTVYGSHNIGVEADILIDEMDLTDLERALLEIPPKSPIGEATPRMAMAEGAMSIREAMLAPSELLPAGACLGRILAVPTVGCPPAVPIVVCGERIDEHALACFSYYGIENCCVVKE